MNMNTAIDINRCACCKTRKVGSQKQARTRSPLQNAVISWQS